MALSDYTEMFLIGIFIVTLLIIFLMPNEMLGQTIKKYTMITISTILVILGFMMVIRHLFYLGD